MKLRWSSPAAENLQEIVEYIAADNRDAAARTAQRIVAAIERAALMPYSGRIGKVPGTREMVVTGTPYLAVYRIRAEVVEVLSIRHGAQDWPKSL